MNFIFKDLPYGYNELKSVSPRALELHHKMHYKAYLDNLNKLLTLQEPTNNQATLHDIINISHNKINPNNSSPINANDIKIFNNAAQVFNHEFYWSSMSPNGGGQIDSSSSLHEAIFKNGKFANFDEFINKFKEISIAQFGSGWSWLVFNKETNSVEILSTSNAFTPLTNSNLIPLLTIDVWEHAYYRDYENKRDFYLDKFFENLINWKFAEENFKKITLQ